MKVKWTGPVSQVKINYRAADKENQSGIGQHIGVGAIASPLSWVSALRGRGLPSSSMMWNRGPTS